MQSKTPSANSLVVAFDLIAFVALAAAIAMAAAVVLVATVLLLAGRAEAAPADEAKQGTLLLRTLDGRQAPSAPLLSTDVAFRVSGMVQSLIDSIREGAREEDVRTQVIELATAHRLVTKYTSFVAVDKTPARASDARLKLAAVPTNLPDGREHDKVFGELPQGSTDSRYAMLTGALLLLLALAMLHAPRRWRLA